MDHHQPPAPAIDGALAVLGAFLIAAAAAAAEIAALYFYTGASQ